MPAPKPTWPPPTASLADGHRVVVTAQPSRDPLVRITTATPPTASTRSRPTYDRSQLDQVLALTRAQFGRVDMIVDPELYRSSPACFRLNWC